MIIRKLFIAFSLMLLAPSAAIATPISYFFTGPPLPAVAGVPAGVTGITGSFTVDLPASNTDPLLYFPLLDFDLTDGLSIFNPGSTDLALSASLFLTNDEAGITSFLLQLIWNPLNTAGHPWTVGDAGYMEIRFRWLDDETFLFDEYLSVVSYCTISNPLDGTCAGTATTFSDQPGTLDVVNVLEPGTLALFGTSLLALGLVRRRQGKFLTEPQDYSM